MHSRPDAVSLYGAIPDSVRMDKAQAAMWRSRNNELDGALKLRRLAAIALQFYIPGT